MAFIKTIRAADAAGDVRDMYARQESAWGYVPDYAKVFCHRPAVMGRWGMMLAEIKRPVDPRRLETRDASPRHTNSIIRPARSRTARRSRRSSARTPSSRFSTAASATRSPRPTARSRTSPGSVARDASQITEGEIAALREIHGLSDAEIFDIAAIAAARAFFTKVLDAMGCEPDVPFMHLDDDLRRALTVGRPIKCTPPEVLDGARAA